MAAKGTRVSQLFDQYKKQGMTDSAAMQKAMKKSQEETIASRKAKRPMGKLKRFKKGVKSVIAGAGHSPAGKKHLKRKK